jgi:hypothetical protein
LVRLICLIHIFQERCVGSKGERFHIQDFSRVDLQKKMSWFTMYMRTYRASCIGDFRFSVGKQPLARLLGVPPSPRLVCGKPPPPPPPPSNIKSKINTLFPGSCPRLSARTPAQVKTDRAPRGGWENNPLCVELLPRALHKYYFKGDSSPATMVASEPKGPAALCDTRWANIRGSFP